VQPVSANELSSELLKRYARHCQRKLARTLSWISKQTRRSSAGVTKIGDLVLDGSIKTQLLNMRESLKGVRAYNGIKAEEISQIIKDQIKDYDKKVELSETGIVCRLAMVLPESTALRKQWPLNW